MPGSSGDGSKGSAPTTNPGPSPSWTKMASLRAGQSKHRRLRSTSLTDNGLPQTTPIRMEELDAAGVDDIPTEASQWLQGDNRQFLLDLSNNTLSSQSLPQGWHMALVVEILDLISIVDSSQLFQVRATGQPSEVLEAKSGICQGRSLSPYLFLFVHSMILYDVDQQLTQNGSLMPWVFSQQTSVIMFFHSAGTTAWSSCTCSPAGRVCVCVILCFVVFCIHVYGGQRSSWKISSKNLMWLESPSVST